MEWVGQRRPPITITAVTFGIFKHSSPNTGQCTSTVFGLCRTARPTYYIFKARCRLYVIVGFALFQFAWMCDQGSARRLNLQLVALMLSSFAIHGTVTDRLPRVPSGHRPELICSACWHCL